MRALSIRQPFAELILRGMKTIEYRSRPTRIVGERFWIYASKRELSVAGCQLLVKAGKNRITGDNIAVPEEALPPWMVELAGALKLWRPGELPTGVIVGSAVISKCEEAAGDQLPVVSTPRDGSSRAPDDLQPATLYHWHLADVQRDSRLLKPKGHPQPVWFNPF